MSPALLVPIVVTSFVGSLHCAGMCGPFVAFYSAGDASRGLARLSSHLLYNFGRLISYATLGAVAGAIGAALDLAGVNAGLGRIAGIVAGATMIAWGLVLLLQSRGFRLPSSGVAGRIVAPLMQRFQRAVARLRGKPPRLVAFALGLSSALLPCGFLYAFAVTAAGTASVLWGALVMSAFWLGGAVPMLALGLGIQFAATKIRRHVPVIAATGLLALGLFSVMSRLSMPALATQAHGGSPPCHHEAPP